jgi:hypothetical protein
MQIYLVTNCWPSLTFFRSSEYQTAFSEMFTFQTAKFPRSLEFFSGPGFSSSVAKNSATNHLEDSLCIVVIKLVPGEDLLPGLGVLEELGLVIGHFLGQQVSTIFIYFLPYIFEGLIYIFVLLLTDRGQPTALCLPRLQSMLE